MKNTMTSTMKNKPSNSLLGMALLFFNRDARYSRSDTQDIIQQAHQKMRQGEQLIKKSQTSFSEIDLEIAESQRLRETSVRY